MFENPCMNYQNCKTLLGLILDIQELYIHALYASNIFVTVVA